MILLYLIALLFFFNCILKGFLSVFTLNTNSSFFCSLVGTLFFGKILFNGYNTLKTFENKK